MDAIIERVVEKDAAAARQIARDDSLSPIQKIFQILTAQQPKQDDSKELLIEQFHHLSNAEMHQKSITRSVLALAPVLAEVVREGIDSGIFHTEYPKETMEFLILAGQNLFDPSMFQWSEEELAVKMNAFIATMETLLGAGSGSFSCIREILSGEESKKGKNHAE